MRGSARGGGLCDREDGFGEVEPAPVRPPSVGTVTPLGCRAEQADGGSARPGGRRGLAVLLPRQGRCFWLGKEYVGMTVGETIKSWWGGGDDHLGRRSRSSAPARPRGLTSGAVQTTTVTADRPRKEEPVTSLPTSQTMNSAPDGNEARTDPEGATASEAQLTIVDQRRAASRWENEGGSLRSVESFSTSRPAEQQKDASPPEERVD
jgi:hypothetical protein